VIYYVIRARRISSTKSMDRPGNGNYSNDSGWTCRRRGHRENGKRAPTGVRRQIPCQTFPRGISATYVLKFSNPHSYPHWQSSTLTRCEFRYHPCRSSCCNVSVVAGAECERLQLTTALSFLPDVLANDLMVSSVPFTMIGASYTGELATGWEPSTG